MPPPFPAVLVVARVVSAQALVSYRGNRYSVPPQLHGATVTVHTRLGSTHLDIATTPGTPGTPGRASPVPTIIARHLIAPTGAGVTIRDDGHVTALSAAVLSAFTTEPPHRRKERRPPTTAALAEADHLRARNSRGTSGSGAATTEDAEVVIDLARYAAAARGRNTLHPSHSTTTP